MDFKFEIVIDSSLKLSALDECHAEELFVLTDSNREYLRVWLPWLDKNKYPQNSLDFIRSSKKRFTQGLCIDLGVFSKEKLAGIITLYALDWLNRSASIGYWIGEEYQGRGFMRKSCIAVLGYAFNDLELNRVDIRCAPGNSRSRAIPANLGFREEGVLRQAEWLYDHYVDHIVYSMLKEEWEVDHEKTPLNPEEEEGGLREAKGKM